MIEVPLIALTARVADPDQLEIQPLDGTNAVWQRVLPAIRVLACTCSMSVGCMVSTAMAVEPDELNWAPGAPGTYFGALPPAPGIFLLNQSSYFTAKQLNGPDGKKNTAVDLDRNGNVNVSRILGVWPGDLDGWRFATQVVLPFAYNKTEIGPFVDEAGGFANMALAQISNYTFGDYHNVGVSVGYDFHTSDYDPSKLARTQNGYSSVDALVHYNYFDPTGLDFGVMAGYHYNIRNETTDYLSGDLFSLDFKLTYAVNDKLRIGGYGGFLTQIEDDKIGSTTVSNNRYKGLKIGPSLTYNFGPAEVSLSYQFMVQAQNAPKTNTLWLSVLMPLYVPQPQSVVE